MSARSTNTRPFPGCLAAALCLFWLCGVVMAATPQSPSLQLTDAEMAWRKAQPPLRVGVFAGDHMPVEGWVAGRAEGVGPDYARLLAQRAGLRVSYLPFTAWTPVAFKGAEVSTDFDLLVGQPILPGPSTAFTFLRPYATGRYVAVVKRGQPRVRSEADLATARIVVERSFVSTSRELESRYPDAVHLRAANGRDALAMVARGEADAYVGATEFRTRHLLRQSGNDALEVVDTVPIPPLQLGVAVNTADPMLASVLKRAEATITLEELEALRLRWGVTPDESHTAPAAGLTLDERLALARLPRLRVGFEVDRPPYSFINEAGDFDGLAADYLNYLRNALGFDMELVPARDWKELQALARAREVDIVAVAVPGDVDGSEMLFTSPYETFPEVIVAGVNGPPITGPEDLAGRRVAIRDEPTLIAKLQAAIPTATLVPVASNETGLAMAADGRVDAYVGTLPAIDALVRDRYAGELRVVGTTGINREFAIGIDKRHAELLPLFNRVLGQVPSHQRMQIRSRWIAGDYQYGLSLAWVLGILLAATAVTSAFAFAYLRMRREVLARRQAEARLASVTKTLPVAVFEVHISEEDVRSFTYAAGDTMGTIGLTADALLADATVVAESIHEDDQAMIEAHVGRAIGELTPIPKMDFRVTTGQGERWIRTAGGVPQARDGTVEWSGYWIDVTDSHEQSAALRDAMQKAEREVEARSSFLAMMSHEIRTPMAGIVSWLELIAEAGLSPEQARMVEMVMESSSALQQILDDILDFSRIDSGRLTVRAEEVDLRSLVDGVVGLFAARAAAKGLGLHSVSDCRVAHCHVGDALRIRQVLSNLVSNAVKFTDHGHVEVRLDWIGDHAGRQLLDFSVIDTGRGMNPEQMRTLFEPFSQVGPDDPALLGGSGLGLTICRRLGRLMGGEVELRSEPGQGTTATLQLELPIAAFAGAFNGGAVPVSGAAPRTAADPARERWRILVVEDHEINRKVVARQVARLGYQCEVAADGEQALVMLAGNRFDLVLTDCHMPQMDGYTLTRLLRQGKVPGMSTIPVIALSAGVLEEQIQRCRDAGMDDFLPKPVLMGALDEAITRHLLPSPPPVTGPASPFLESLDRSDEGGDLLRELLQVSREDLAIYDQLVAAGDTNAAREMLHRMRGALLLLGVRMPLGTTGAGSRDAVAEAMAQLERLVGRLRS